MSRKQSYYRNSDGLDFYLIIFLIVSFGIPVIIGVKAAHEYFGFGIGCGQYLERAANATNIQLAKENLDTAIKYLDDHKLTTGYSSIFWDTPSADIGYWYKNLKTTSEELSKVPANASQLEQSNVLLKLRETILSHGDQGDYVIQPDNIGIHPYGRVYIFFLILIFTPIPLIWRWFIH